MVYQTIQLGLISFLSFFKGSFIHLLVHSTIHSFSVSVVADAGDRVVTKADETSAFWGEKNSKQ